MGLALRKGDTDVELNIDGETDLSTKAGREALAKLCSTLNVDKEEFKKLVRKTSFQNAVEYYARQLEISVKLPLSWQDKRRMVDYVNKYSKPLGQNYKLTMNDSDDTVREAASHIQNLIKAHNERVERVRKSRYKVITDKQALALYNKLCYISNILNGRYMRKLLGENSLADKDKVIVYIKQPKVYELLMTLHNFNKLDLSSPSMDSVEDILLTFTPISLTDIIYRCIDIIVDYYHYYTPRSRVWDFVTISNINELIALSNIHNFYAPFMSLPKDCANLFLNTLITYVGNTKLLNSDSSIQDLLDAAKILYDKLPQNYSGVEACYKDLLSGCITDFVKSNIHITKRTEALHWAKAVLLILLYKENSDFINQSNIFKVKSKADILRFSEKFRLTERDVSTLNEEYHIYNKFMLDACLYYMDNHS